MHSYVIPFHFPVKSFLLCPHTSCFFLTNGIFPVKKCLFLFLGLCCVSYLISGCNILEINIHFVHLYDSLRIRNVFFNIYIPALLSPPYILFNSATRYIHSNPNDWTTWLSDGIPIQSHMCCFANLWRFIWLLSHIYQSWIPF